MKFGFQDQFFMKKPKKKSRSTLSQKITKKKLWHVTHNMWRVTCDMWYVIHDPWHVTYDTWRKVNTTLKFPVPGLYGLGVKVS